MSSVTTKNLMLSQRKGEPQEELAPMILSHTSKLTEENTEIKVEIPGVDPSTVDVNIENNTLFISCERGSLTLPVNQSIDTSKIKADILWGMLTLTIPLPTPPASRAIKVSIHDPIKRAPSKTTEKFTDED